MAKTHVRECSSCGRLTQDRQSTECWYCGAGLENAVSKAIEVESVVTADRVRDMGRRTVALALFGTVALVVGLRFFMVALDTVGAEATGNSVASRMEEHTDKDGNVSRAWDLIIEFSPPGQPRVQFDVTLRNPPQARYRVYYNPDRPHRASLNSPSFNRTVVFYAWSVSGLCLLGAVVSAVYRVRAVRTLHRKP